MLGRRRLSVLGLAKGLGMGLGVPMEDRSPVARFSKDCERVGSLRLWSVSLEGRVPAIRRCLMVALSSSLLRPRLSLVVVVTCPSSAELYATTSRSTFRSCANDLEASEPEMENAHTYITIAYTHLTNLLVSLVSVVSLESAVFVEPAVSLLTVLVVSLVSSEP